MSAQHDRVGTFLQELMQRQKRLPSQLASDLGISHATVGRWLSGKDIPNTKSCLKLAEYSGVRLEKILFIAGHLPRIEDAVSLELPEFHA